MTPRQQRDRRGTDRRGAALAAIWPSVARFQPRPCDTSGETLIVKPGRLVINNARRQDLVLPRSGRRLEPFELADDGIDGVRPRHPRIGVNPLPAKEEAQKVARGDRLDFGAEAVDRVAVNPGEQPALAPFVFGRPRREASAQGEAFGLESSETGREVLCLESKRRREPGREVLCLEA